MDTYNYLGTFYLKSEDDFHRIDISAMQLLENNEFFLYLIFYQIN